MRAQVSTHTTLLCRLADPEDSAAWREFHARYGELIQSFARRRGLQQADCEDLMQEVLVGLTRSMPGFEYDPARGRFRSFLKTVVVRAISRRFRQSVPSSSLVDGGGMDFPHEDGDEAEGQWELEWRQYHLRRALHAVEMEFSHADVTAFRHYAIDGADPQSTADLLGLSVNQVYKAKSNILKRLGEIIAVQIEEEG